MNTRKLSPFAQLLKFLESEVFDLSLTLQNAGARTFNIDFVMGYRCALNVILERAYSIYNRRYPEGMLALDERTEEATEILLRMLKKRGS
jgi:hypothetical protein